MTRARIQLKFLTSNPTLLSTFHLDLLFLSVASATVKIEDKVVVVIVKALFKYKNIAPAIEEFIIWSCLERELKHHSEWQGGVVSSPGWRRSALGIDLWTWKSHRRKSEACPGMPPPSWHIKYYQVIFFTLFNLLTRIPMRFHYQTYLADEELRW